MEQYLNQKFGRLTVKAVLNNPKVLCACDCGNEKSVSLYHLRDGKIQSCGCLRRENMIARNYKHGMSDSPEYVSWDRIKQRTTNPLSQDWHLYGGRGIKLSSEFTESFECFYEHIGPKPNDGLRYSVGRINNDQGYERGNIRWETDYEQAQNRRMASSNTSGETGVCLSTKIIEGRTYTAWVAFWNPIGSSKKRTKNFSTNKYGYDEAFRLACEYRKTKILELNATGAGYSETHGK